jgi:hypothetical protein
MRSVLHRLLLGLSAVAVLLFPVESASTSYVYVPLATRVEKADLIVIGKVIRDTPDFYKTPYDNCGRGQAVLMVTEVLRGKLESPRAERMTDGAYVQTIGIRHYGDRPMDSDPNQQGIWMVRRSDIAGIYCSDFPWAEQMEQLANVRKVLHTLDTSYRGYRSGFPMDDRTWLTTFGNGDRYSHTNANVCVLPDGAVFVEGSIYQELFVSDRLVLSIPQKDHFLARLGADGTMQWVRAMGSEQRFDAKPVTGLDGSCVLIGAENAACGVLGTTMPWTGGRPQLITEISRNGKVRWALTVTDGAYPENRAGLFKNGSLPGRSGRVTGIAIAAGRDAYHLIVSFTGEVVFDKRSFVSEENGDWIVATIGSEGQIIDIHQVTRDRNEDISQLVIGADGQLIAGGRARIYQHFSEAFVTAMSSDGRELWTRYEGGPSDCHLVDLAVGTDGTLVAMIQMVRDANPSMSQAMCAWNSSGKKLWRIDGGGSDIKVGSDGSTYCLGSYGDHFGVAPLDMPESAGDNDLFISRYDRHGKRTWVKREGGLSGERATSLHLVGNRAIVAGYFEGMAPLVGKVVTPRGRADLFLMNIPLDR